MVLKELTTYLALQGIGTQGTNLFYGILPPDPDTVVTLFEYGGEAAEPNLGLGTVNIEYPRVQVLCRGARDQYDEPRLVAQNIVGIFTAVMNKTLAVGGPVYKAIEALDTPRSLRRDENFRIEIVVNFRITKGYSST